VRTSPEAKRERILLLNVREAADFSATIFEREFRPRRSSVPGAVLAVKKRKNELQSIRQFISAK